MSKVLIISEYWASPSLSLSIKNEGHDVLLYLNQSTDALKGTISRNLFAERMDNMSKDDLIIYENKSFNGEPIELRKKGFNVIGGGKITDKIELDRVFGNKLAGLLGIKVPEMIEVNSFEEIRNLILERGGKWVLKQEGKLNDIKGLNFVSKMDNSEDLLDFLEILEKNWIEDLKKDFVMQEKIEGHEMAVGSFWNGTEFMKDQDGDELCYENWEHKALFPGNLGEATGEQYTVIQCTKAKYSKIFSETLEKCRPLLKEIDYRGYFDVNTIINEKGAWFLEFTPRMGVPFASGLLEIHKSSWYDFLLAIASGGQDKKFEYDDRYCIVSWLYTKPFPAYNSHRLVEIYKDQDKKEEMKYIEETMSFKMSNPDGIKLNFKKDFTKEDWSHIHPDSLVWRNNRLQIANSDGYILTATQSDDTVEGAGEKLNELLKKIIVPKAFWRNDFDKSNYHKSKDDLIKWGYILEDRKDKIKQEKENLKKVQSEEKRKKVRENLKKIVYAKS